MLFNSFDFLLFFPIVTLLYFALPFKYRWMWLLFASYYFYMSWNATYALLMGTSTIITFVSGLLIERSKRIDDPKKSIFLSKFWLTICLVLNLSILISFKYFYFVIENINFFLEVSGATLISPAFDIILPVGISFYTFQALSYSIDVYRGDVDVEHNFGKYALFVSFFPQLVAGPIERSKNLLSQVHRYHPFNSRRVTKGLLLMLWGYFQKVVVADRAAVVVNTVFDGYVNFNGAEVLLSVILFAVQIYCDFSGYSDIAIGAAQIMGFSLMDNFHQPYFAKSIREFWQRWHISLSTWFRDYVYIPLGGNRGSKLKKYRNLMITFIVSGLWHGANWTFVIWGALHGLFQIIGDVTYPLKQKLYGKLKRKQSSWIFQTWKMFCTFCLVCFAWIFFRAENLQQAAGIINHIGNGFFSSLSNYNLGSLLAMGLDRNNMILLFVSIVLLWCGNFLQSKVVVREVIMRQKIVIRWVIYYASLLAIILWGYFSVGGASEFIYFQF